MIRNITTNETYLLHLLACAMNNIQPEEKPEQLKWEDVHLMAVRHSVAGMAYLSVLKLHKQPDESLMATWKERYEKAVAKEARQQIELAKLIVIFRSAHIPMMPLKGSVLAPLYPAMGMRSMADLDILIYEKDAKKVQELLLRENYTCESYGKGNHDVYHKLPILNVEIHRELLPDRMEEQYPFFRNIWQKAVEKPDKPNVYELPPEELYAFLMSHIYKHFSGGGSGIRSVLDIYLMNKIYGTVFDKTKLTAILEQLRLTDFEAHMRELAYVWYGTEAADSAMPEYGTYIFSSGTYGTRSNRVDNGVKEKGKWGYMLSRAFLPFKQMAESHPILKSLPFLLPVFWIWRLLSAFFTKNRKMMSELKLILRGRGQKK